MSQCYRYGNESQSSAAFSGYSESQYLSSGVASQPYYSNPALAGTQQAQYYGHTTKPALGYNHNLGSLPLVPGYQQASSYSNYGTGANTNLTQSYGPAPVTGYYGKHHESHVKKTFRKQNRDGFGTSVEYSSFSDSETDDEGPVHDEGRVRRCL